MNVAKGYGSQVLDIENDSRAYSDATTDYILNRYGSVDKLGETFYADPVGVLGDVSTAFTGGAGAVRSLGKTATTASKVAKAGKVSTSMAKAGNNMEKVSGVLNKVANVSDPLTHASKVMSNIPVKPIFDKLPAEAKQIINKIPVETNKVKAKILDSLPNEMKKIQPVLKITKKNITPASRFYKSFLGIGSSANSASEPTDY